MITSGERSRQVSPVSAVQSHAVARIGLREVPRKVNLQARTKPPTRSVNPSDSDVCAREMSVADPTTFQFERRERHSFEMLARIFPPNTSASNSSPTRWLPRCEKSAVSDGTSKPRVKLRPPRVKRVSCQLVAPRSCEKVWRNHGDAIVTSSALKRPASIWLAESETLRNKITVGPSSTRKWKGPRLRLSGSNFCRVAQPPSVNVVPVV